MDTTILDDWCTKSQAAATLQVSEKTIERLATKGVIRRATRKRPGIRPLPVAVEPLASPRFFPVKPRLETLVGPVGHALSNLSLGRVTLTVWIPRFLMTGAPNLKQRQPCRSPKRPSNGLPPKASFAVLRASAPASARFPSRWSRLLRRASSR